jgi:putative heme-binding domain-containing protein
MDQVGPSSQPAVSEGRILTGILKNETPETLEIEDADARRLKIDNGEIGERKQSEVSIMPSGLAQGLSRQDFADPIAYLETLKEATAASEAPAGGSRKP